MFDRENAGYVQDKAIAVKIELQNGNIISGNMVVGQTSSLREAINDKKQYIEFTTYEGKQQYIAKKAIVQIGKIERPAEADQLMRHFNKLNAYNPYLVLGLIPNASKEDVQTAYHKLAKEYHPDRFVNVALPSEAMQYMIAMSKRINAAYTELAEVTPTSMAS